MLDEVPTEKKNEPLPNAVPRSRNAHLHAVRALQGSLAHFPFSSDDFARLKQEEIEREEQQFARPFPDVR